MLQGSKSLLARYPVATYFGLTFLVSWSGALAVASPHLLRREPLPQLTGILMFPAMLLGPSAVGILLTRMVDGPGGLRDLWSRIFWTPHAARWYVFLALPPVLVFGVLFFMSWLASPAYAPNFFAIGMLFGIPAGLLEEIGWTGYVFPKMCRNSSALAASILLGSLWLAWHLPVVNYLGTATPHGAYWFPYFLTFGASMTAIRVLICYIYVNTKSVLLAQLMHISSTGSLVVFSPRVTAWREVLWYLLYATALWLVINNVVRKSGKNLLHRPLDTDKLSQSDL